MYLSNIKLWNFRKFGSVGDMDLERPNLCMNFTPGLNVLIGENDSGKTAILEAIKMVLKTHAYERIVWEDDDFFNGTDEIRIELLIDGLKPIIEEFAPTDEQLIKQIRSSAVSQQKRHGVNYWRSILKLAICNDANMFAWLKKKAS